MDPRTEETRLIAKQLMARLSTDLGLSDIEVGGVILAVVMHYTAFLTEQMPSVVPRWISVVGEGLVEMSQGLNRPQDPMH